MAEYVKIFAAKDKSGKMMTLGMTDEGNRPQVLGSTTIETDKELQMLKKQVRADDFNDDDDYLQQLLDVADEYICKYTNRNREELVEMGGGQMPRMLFQAKLLIAAHWYNQREAVSQGEMKEVPYTLSALIKPFRKLAEDRK